jgi:hypothetical protein
MSRLYPPRSHAASAQRKQRGQAMIETLVAATLVLVPLFLAIPIIAKYQDIRSHVVQGARYAAWERTVWFGGAAAAPMGFGSSKTLSNKWSANAKSDDDIRAEIGHRILSKSTGGFNTASDKGTTSSLTGHDTWRDRRGNTMLQSYSNIAGSYDNETAPGLINDVFEPLMKIAAVVSSFTLDTKAQYTATLGLTVREVAFNGQPWAVPPQQALSEKYPGDFLVSNRSLNFSEKNVIVANGWSANGPGSFDEFNSSDPDISGRISVYNQVRGLTPSSILKPKSGVFKTVLDVLNVIALIFFPELSTLDLGRIEVDRVPADRLQ